MSTRSKVSHLVARLNLSKTSIYCLVSWIFCIQIHICGYFVLKSAPLKNVPPFAKFHAPGGLLQTIRQFFQTINTQATLKHTLIFDL